MVGKSGILIGLTFTLSAVGALAADPPAPSPSERRICRGATKSLGSHIRAPRRCRTAEQWEEEDQAKARVPISARVTAGQNDGRQPTAPR